MANLMEVAARIEASGARKYPPASYDDDEPADLVEALWSASPFTKIRADLEAAAPPERPADERVEFPVRGWIEAAEQRGERQIKALNALVDQLEAQARDGARMLWWARAAGVAGVAGSVVAVVAIIVG